MSSFREVRRLEIVSIMSLILVTIFITTAEAATPVGEYNPDLGYPTRNLVPLEYNIEILILNKKADFHGFVEIYVKFKSTKSPFKRLMGDALQTCLPQSSDPLTTREPRNSIILQRSKDLEIDEESLKIMAAKSMEELKAGKGNRLLHTSIEYPLSMMAINLVKNIPSDYYGKISMRYKTKSSEDSRIYTGEIQDPFGGEKQQHWYGASRLNYFEAHKLVPCFDEPNLKAKISLNVKHRFSDEIVISNMPIEYEPTIEFMFTNYQRKRAEIEQTSVPIPISSIAFAIGPYQRAEYSSHPSLDQSMNSIKVNFFEPSGHQGEGKLALEFAIKTVKWFQDHASPKNNKEHLLQYINLVAVPSNDKWRISDGAGIGLIDYDYLLIDDKLSSNERKIEAALNVALVVAKQWFGHLMVPKSAGDTWITEGLAFHTAVRIVESFEPRFKIRQYVADRQYRRVVFEQRFSELQESDRFLMNQLDASSVFDLLRANIVHDDQSFNDIIRKLIESTTPNGISQSDLAHAFAVNGFSSEEIDKIIHTKRKSLVRNSLRVNLYKYNGEIELNQGDQSAVRWPVKIWLKFSNVDGTKTESIGVAINELEKGYRRTNVKIPEWFSSSEDNWVIVDLGKDQILPYHQLSYSQEALLRLCKPIRTNQLEPAERIAILRQQMNTIETERKSPGHVEVDFLIDLIGCYTDEKDPDVLLEVLDTIKWTSQLWPRIRGYHYDFKQELEKIYTNLGGIKEVVTNDEAISKQRAQSAVALMRLYRFSEREVVGDAIDVYNHYGASTPAYLRSAVFRAVCDLGFTRGPNEKLYRGLKNAGLPEERSRAECFTQPADYW
uniref:Puromycin-sensitive aminopeptidase n=1 Tax=Aceria tosichella TaxID=561515 RepID=A0A6G1S509_9ACAR